MTGELKTLVSFLLVWTVLNLLPGTVAQDACQMCESADAVLSNPDKVIPFLGQSGQIHPTCQQVFDFASSVETADFETCSLIQGQAAFCGCPETSGEPIDACSLCPEGPDSMPGAPDYITSYGGTCADLHEYISFMPQTECNKFDRSDLLFRNNWICQCPNATVGCSLCPDKTLEMMQADLVIPYFPIPNNEKPTCEEARNFASVRDVSECGLYRNNAGYCGCPTTRSGDPVEPLNVCSLCPDGSDPNNPELITPSGDVCADLQFFVSFLDEEGCQSTTAGLITANAFICGCPGVDEPICEFCPSGAQVSDPEKSTENGNLTCADLELLVWTLGENLCEARDQIIQQGRDLCCTGSGAASWSIFPFSLGIVAALVTFL